MDHRSFQWDRIGAFLLGAVTLTGLLWATPDLPDPIAYGVVAVPLGLCYHGFTSKSARSVARLAALVAVGLTLGSWLADAGVL
ncbi:hypothetical protein JCM30237_28370 [Halolamina litorea]|uniref:Uncharacterized protein n=1 Tax=Halolamina litorea TaxID=1515593 RepID=A0ABD6BVL6_9EURY|nr:hypothetical protein [Halolamina litorea]